MKEIAGAKRFTSSAVRFLVRSVTAHKSVLRVPTKTTPLDGPTAMAGIGRYGVEVDAKPFGQLDALEVLADGVGGGAVLGNGLHVQGLAGGLHRAHAL